MSRHGKYIGSVSGEGKELFCGIYGGMPVSMFSHPSIVEMLFKSVKLVMMKLS